MKYKILGRSGLRVSELVGLQLSDLFFEEGFIRVLGKGNKQRFVPINTQTQKYITNYINGIRVLINVKKGFEDTVFLNRRGKNLTRVMIFTIVKRKEVPHVIDIIHQHNPTAFYSIEDCKNATQVRYGNREKRKNKLSLLGMLKK